jgi:c-di-GMP-binding flagellar brake protein YcgR
MEWEAAARGPSDDLRGKPSDRRAQPRFGVDQDALMLLVSHGLALESHILDLSLTGCRVRTREPYTAGTRMRVEVTFKVNGMAFRFLGAIQWIAGEHLVGVRFVEVIARRSEQLAEVIGELASAAAARAAKEAEERAAMESAAEPPGEEFAQRDVEKQAEDPFPLPRVAPAKHDRRSQERREVDTTASIFLIKMGVTLRGHILDLSMGGCRIRAEEKLLVGLYTRVETEFRLEGLPFRLGGVIQAVHDPHSVGIRFLDVSLRRREQVEQLIAEMDEMRGRAGEAARGQS